MTEGGWTADQRVFQNLSENLFDGVFGVSDEVLGALEAGVDFERRIVEIYQSCRTPGQIDAAVDALQVELEGQIAARGAATRAQPSIANLLPAPELLSLDPEPSNGPGRPQLAVALPLFEGRE